MEREAMEFDVVIVGGGPAGLASAIRLKQLAAEKGSEISVCLIEKGAEIGAHILSGAVMDPRALNELLPDWKADGAPLNAPVSEDRFFILSETGAPSVPTACCRPASTTKAITSFRSAISAAGSASRRKRWASRSTPASPAPKCCSTGTARSRASPPATWAACMTVRKDPNFQPGMELHGKYTFFAEGCRGHLGKQLIDKFNLNDGADPQTYGIGIKELWEIEPASHQLGLVVHSGGWPMEPDTYGGGFLYHLENNQVAVGFVVGLGYSNPHLSPFEEFQRYKTHPEIRKFLEGGKRIAYGARALTAGGIQSLPKLTFPGGVLVGDDAGFLNAARIKGSHCAIKSGMLAAESLLCGAGRRAPARRTDRLPGSLQKQLAVRRTLPGTQLQAVDEQGTETRFAHVRHRPDRVSRQGAVDPAPQDARPR